MAEGAEPFDGATPKDGSSAPKDGSSAPSDGSSAPKDGSFAPNNGPAGDPRPAELNDDYRVAEKPAPTSGGEIVANTVTTPSATTTSRKSASPTYFNAEYYASRDSSEPSTITIPIVIPGNQHARVWMVLAGVLGIMLIAAIVIIGYMWNVNDKWQAQVASLTETGYGLGDRISEHEREIVQLQATNNLLSDQLATAKDRVLALSDEKAQWSDETAYAEQQVALLVDQVATAQDVVAQMGRCLEGEQQLVTYLSALDQYPPEEVAVYRASVESLCTAASQSAANFQKSLTE